MRSDGKPNCQARRKSGEPCKGLAVAGTDRCRMHAGRRGSQQKAVGRVAAEVMAWGLTDAKVDPAETLLRLLAQSARRAALYADLLEQQYDGTGDMGSALA